MQRILNNSLFIQYGVMAQRATVEEVTSWDLYAWGRNNYGQLGDGTTTNRLTPTAIGSSTWKSVSGSTHSLGIRGDGKLYAWGRNNYGQLGDGTTTDRLTPTAIGSSTWKSVSGGSNHSLGILL
jgi:alpha-tubulin suppressor-like RCC1 family protein